MTVEIKFFFKPSHFKNPEITCAFEIKTCVTKRCDINDLSRMNYTHTIGYS